MEEGKEMNIIECDRCGVKIELTDRRASYIMSAKKSFIEHSTEFELICLNCFSPRIIVTEKKSKRKRYRQHQRDQRNIVDYVEKVVFR